MAMSALGFCRECGNMIQRHYHYCPFCGDRQGQAPVPPGEMPRPSRQEDPVTRARGYLDRLSRLENRLILLDRELDSLIDRRASSDPPPVSAAATTPAPVPREITP